MKFLASIWLTLILLTIAAALLLYSRMVDETVSGKLIAMPLVGLCLNLMVAIVYNRKLRTQGGLLVFHLALAAVAGLAAFGQLSAVIASIELTEGSEFDPNQITVMNGSLNRDTLHRIRFIQGPFSINYKPGMTRRETYSTVKIQGPDGKWDEQIVGDHYPLIINGYRFYTTSNKGFATLLSYTDKAGQISTGSVHFPGYPLNEAVQANSWTAPDTAKTVALWLELSAPIYTEDAQWQFSVPKDASLVVTVDDVRTTLLPGQVMPIGGGTLRYGELRAWMGYGIYYNPAMSWILAASLVAVCGLGWHCFLKIRSTPWDAAQYSLKSSLENPLNR